jgi:hypothetical protein
MMIRNPSMKLDNLPDLPTPDDFVNNVTQVGSRDGTDVATIALAAKAIAQRAPWNPFYRLLSEGPTDAVRSLIVERCPTPGATSERNAWIWEVPPEEAIGSKSMGWDCVFVAELYNKMRVKKDISDELMDWALKLGDGFGTSLTIASRALDLAQAGNALAHKALDEAERDQKKATDFVSSGYAAAKQAGLAKVQDIQNRMADLAQQSVDLQKKINDLNIDLAALPLTVMREAEKVCKDGGILVDPLGCTIVREAGPVANPAIDEMKGKIKGANDALADIQNNQISEANNALKQAENELSALDDELQVVQKEIASGVLENIRTGPSPSRAGKQSSFACTRQRRQAQARRLKATKLH